MKRSPAWSHRDAEAEGVGRGLRRVGEVGGRHHPDIVGIGAQRRDHARAADHDAGIGLLHHLGGEVLVLLLHRTRAIDLRIDQRVRHHDVVLAGVQVVVPEIVGVASPNA